jgi:hypothetical protein
LHVVRLNLNLLTSFLRDLAFALFCVGAGASEDEQNDSENQQAASKQWSIPRVHSVMASLINSWLSSCSVGWPVPRLLNEVPCQFEEVCIEPVASDKPLTETGDVDMPPSEIIITDHANVSNSLDVVQSPEVEGDQICPLLVKFSYWNDIVDVSRKDWWYTLVSKSRQSPAQYICPATPDTFSFSTLFSACFVTARI